ncbi:M20/M25/M40 family metallo-hydrolase [Solirubrobacter sp. CPCC 204708]|uniref:M20/M25/M40 family metallo-hydrolase n=1 Tax=Solirubrobacter deserti TaxID=2282478 RepID=A0ABT4RSV3_9ACTN|nr:M20/M25/M40 family metallo-hydrolase [Solirubrobacter deserti]MBE2320932.1 M20/M25/M40 family metallo-hydrolase [Solirubrobacter deserti]MDA0141672.1 M20/M25/M40 family metallo-hydrolase [Solirubrobacter deserti]
MASASPELELTRELVALNTVNPGLVPGAPGERAAVELLAARLEPQHFAIEIVGPEDRPSLVATRRVGDGPLLALNGHLDTVGAGGMQDPFTPRIEDGRLYGRGTCDMKAGVAACVVAAEAVPAANVLLALVADEENDSLGTLAVLEHLGADLPGACIVAEPTWLELAATHRGFSVVEVEIRGRAAHSSRPDDGVNAVEHLGRLLHALEPPLMATVVHGGTAPFLIPDRAVATVEHRTQPGEPLHAGLDAVRALIDRLDLDATATELIAREAWQLADGPLVDLFDRALDHPARFDAPYWMESALWEAAGVPTVVCGPAGGGLHTDVEWVDLEQLAVYTRALTEILRGWRDQG